MVDPFFEEVEEGLRADKVKDAARRYLPWVLGLVLGVVVIGGGYLGWRYWQDQRIAKASEAYEAILRGEVAQDADSAYTAFGEIADKAPPAYKTLALMNQGAIRMEQGRVKDAVELWDRAAKAAPRGKAGQVLADSARLKSALALLDEATYADSEARLTPLTEEGRPFRSMAREALALAKLMNGKTAEARADFLLLSADLKAPTSISGRAKAAVDLIDNGSAAVVPAAVKAAKAMPAAPAGLQQLPPELLEQLQAQGVQVQGAPAK